MTTSLDQRGALVWPLRTFASLITEMRGGAPLKPSDFTKGGVKVVPKGGIGRSGWLEVEERDLQYCSEEFASAHRTNLVTDKYTLVVLRDLVPSGPSIGLIVQTSDPDCWVLAQGVYGFKLNGDADPAFLSQVSNTQWYRRIMNQIMVGSTQVHITNTAFKSIAIPVPEIKEQRAIATALSDVDALIAGLEKLIAKKRDLKQAAMQQLLTGQTRLPGFSGEWETKRLRDLCEITMGRTPARLNPSFWGGEHVWLSIADLHEKVICHSKEQISDLAVSTMQVIPKGTLLMSFKLSIGRLAFAGCDLYTNEAICAFNKLSANADFLYYALSRTDFSLYGKQAVKGYTLNKESLGLVEVSLPFIAEQVAIAAALHSMDAELAAIETRLAKTRELKQGMMQELLTGLIRLI